MNGFTISEIAALGATQQKQSLSLLEDKVLGERAQYFLDVA
jgi:hypothetical protein